MPLPVTEQRQMESLKKQKQVSQKRLDSIKNRGKPIADEESVVGRL